jgi:GDP-mannose 6-dehydrogenase
MMNISVFGLGYVGTVTAACLAQEEHSVIGVDVVDSKIEQVNAGKTPIIEEVIGELIADNVKSGRLKATKDVEMALTETEMVIVCVGTPSRYDGSLDQRYIRQAVRQIGKWLHERSKPLLIVIRSTMLPGTMRSLVLPILKECSGYELGDRYEVVFHPGFLRE